MKSYTAHKTKYWLFTVVSIINLFFSVMHAEVGCMDKSYHAYRCDQPDVCCLPDYKQLHYVSCTCPCYRYMQLDKRGECPRCLHYHKCRSFSNSYQ